MSKLPPCVLTIAGSDSGGGAGVQADARTIHALGGFACMAITAITAQNTRGVKMWEPVPPALIAAQIAAVLGDVGRDLRTPPSRKEGLPAAGRRLRAGAVAKSTSSTTRATAGSGDPALQQTGALPIRAIKTGLIPGAAAVSAIAQSLSGLGAVPVVVDPVIGSTSGTLFLDRVGIVALKHELLPRATLVTPNWPEAEALSGVQVKSFTAAEHAGRQIADEAGCAVLVKGGHAPGGLCRDCLVMPDGAVHWFECRRVETPNTHGTGCVLSAAIATGLATGRTLERAVAAARDLLSASLRRHRADDWAGAGPAFPG